MDILTKIVTRTREIVAERARHTPLAALKEKIAEAGHVPISLKARVTDQKPAIIAEFKRRSPSKPAINLGADPAEVARAYAAGGAAAMSVLTEPDFFGGAPADLRAVRAQVDLPLLRKDFLVEPYQFYEARALGADLVLLIARCLDRERLAEYTHLAHALGLEVLCEIHGLDELAVVGDAPVDFLGVNCRDLKKFDTNIERLIEVADRLPGHVHLVAESGIGNREDLLRLFDHGYRLFLIGEYLMRGGRPEQKLKELLGP